MKIASRAVTVVLLATTMFAIPAAPGQAQVTPADYERAIGLRAQWQDLTHDVVTDAPTWIAGTHRFWYVRTVRNASHQFMLGDASTREQRPAFDHERLAASLSSLTGEPWAAHRLPFDEIDFTPDAQSIRFSFDDGDFVCRLTDYACSAAADGSGGGQGGGQGGFGGQACQPRSFGVTRDLEVPANNTPRRSPDGRLEAFIENHNVVVRPAGGGPVTTLSTDGSEGNFFDPCSISWSPDSEKLAVYRVKPGYRRLVHYIESAPRDQVQPRHFTQLYTKPGDDVDHEQPVIFHVASERQLNVADELFPNPLSLSQLQWNPDSRALSFNYNQRGHQVYRVIEVDAATGRARALISEEPETFVGGRRYRYDVNGGEEIIWLSEERDGWHHLYLLDGSTGQVKNRITRGDWIVRDVEHVDEQRRQIWFTASGMNPDQDPYFIHYYRIDFDGSNLTALTDANAFHDATFSDDMEYMTVTYSRVDMPNVLELRRATDGAVLMELERGDISALTAAGFRPPEVFTAKARDGVTDIWGVIVRPTNFDPARRYPIVENIYAGPHNSFVPKTFWPFGGHSSGDKVIGMQAHAELGFIVVMIDGMGTLNRSKAFHDYAWKNVGDAGFPDRILWHQAAAARYPHYDASRVGIYGGSAGGQNSTGALLFHPDFYKAAVSYVGCHDNRMDKIGWNERWMGWPVDESYSRSSNVDNAWRLKGNLLLVLGELDQNVDPASTMQVVDALIRSNRMFDLLVIPGEGHGAGRTVGPLEYAARRQYDFFVRHLQGVEPPNWNHVMAATPPGE
ncbi:MAG: DPP IV N-terminal domain-containing protein [Gemmatimonadota bacterium]